MQRRSLLKGTAGLLALPSIARAEATTTLKFIPYADLALLDPIVSAFVTRNHVMMVYDTLFALDETGAAHGAPRRIPPRRSRPCVPARWTGWNSRRWIWSASSARTAG